MFDVSLPWANFWYDAFNALLFVGAFAVAVGTYGSIKMGAIKERFSDERTAALETQTEQAKAELGVAQANIAKANAQIATASTEAAKAVADTAKANERTAELKLALEKEIAARQPRRISPEQKSEILALFKPEPKGPVVVAWKLYDEEAQQFGQSVLSVLQEAGFDAKKGPSPAAFGLGQFIIVRPGMFDGPSYAGSIQTVFRKVLNLEFGAQLRADPTPDVGDVLLIIGSKP